jgi:hypothetical protein
MLRSLLVLLALSCRPADDAPDLASVGMARTFPAGTTRLPQTDFSPYRFGHGMASGDFDGDGDDDLAVGEPGVNGVALYTSDPTGIPLRPTSTWTNARLGYGDNLASLGDLDGDGYDDLGVANEATAPLQAASLHFGSASSLPSTPTRSVLGVDEVIGAGDLNGDGFPDVVMYSRARGDLWWIAGGATARTAAPELLYVGAPFAAVGAADLDVDGLSDLWVQSDTEICWWRGTSLGPDVASPVCGDLSDGTPAAGFGDVDGDGANDLVWLSSELDPLQSASATAGRHVGDVDGDGLGDVAYAVVGPATTTVYLHLGDPEGLSFVPIQSFTGPTSQDWATSILGFDVDADGYPDLLVGDPGSAFDVGEVEVVLGARGDGDHDGDGFAAPEDCDNRDPDISPGALDVTGVLDLNCDDVLACFTDADGDGARTAVVRAGNDLDCDDAGEALPGAVLDCDDGAAAVVPGAVERLDDGVDQDCDGRELCYVDADDDGYTQSVIALSADADCTDPGEAQATAPAGDCDDNNRDASPFLDETASTAFDDDCDGVILCFVDGDFDGDGSRFMVISADMDCDDLGESPNERDCDDTDPARTSNAPEVVGDAFDANCDGRVLCYPDEDGDGTRETYAVASLDADCADPGEARAEALIDCDDGDGEVSPLFPEVPGNDVDEDCSGGVLCFVDNDEDGFFGSALGTRDVARCPAGNVVGDCDDTRADVAPNVVEVDADGVDADCDGIELCYTDLDGDGFRTNVLAGNDADCQDAGEARRTMLSGDCDDLNALAYPSEVLLDEDIGVDLDCDGSVICYRDEDGDGLRTETTRRSADADCDDDGEAGPDAIPDCDDADPLTLDDCGGPTTCFVDDDGDGVRTDEQVDSADGDCRDPGEAYAFAPSGDCDDGNAAAFPGAPEVVGNSRDEDCDAQETCFVDVDLDGFYPTGATVLSVDLDCSDRGEAPRSASPDDCDDDDRRVNPGLVELLGGADEDCDGDVLCAIDDDGDSWPGAAVTSVPGLDCEQPGLTPLSGPLDCDDSDPAFHPQAAEPVQSPDDFDCDNRMKCYADADGDAERSDAAFTLSVDADCADAAEAPSTAVVDCDDADATTRHGAPETPGDDVDSDCDGVDICYADADNDGYRTTVTVPGTTISCSGSGEANAGAPLGDCADADPDSHPFVTDATGDGVDLDCDGRERCYADRDADGFRTNDVVQSADTDCADLGEALASAPSGDCADADPARYPGAVEGPLAATDLDCDGRVNCDHDGDRDGFGTGVLTLSADGDCADAGELPAGGPVDCADNNAALSPGAVEVPGDGVDQDCDAVDSCYADADRDGYRTSTTVLSADLDCADAGEATANLPAGDCADDAAAIHPGAVELAADGEDRDCDGAELCYTDVDRDGYRGEETVVSVDLDCADRGEASYLVASGDCDDDDSLVHPGVTELVANGADDDCDGVELCRGDGDGDGWTTDALVNSDDGDCTDAGERASISPKLDCDDADAAVFPTASEVAGDGVDGNCDGTETCFVDGDGDGFRTPGQQSSVDLDCDDEGEAAAAVPAGDCDDGQPAVFPGAAEVAGDLVDQDCDGRDTPGEGATGCACDQSGSAPWLAVLVAGLALGRRRRA